MTSCSHRTLGSAMLPGFHKGANVREAFLWIECIYQNVEHRASGKAAPCLPYLAWHVFPFLAHESLRLHPNARSPKRDKATPPTRLLSHALHHAAEQAKRQASGSRARPEAGCCRLSVCAEPSTAFPTASPATGRCVKRICILAIISGVCPCWSTSG